MSSENFASLLLDKLELPHALGIISGRPERVTLDSVAQNKSKIEKAAHLLNDNLDGLIL